MARITLSPTEEADLSGMKLCGFAAFKQRGPCRGWLRLELVRRSDQAKGFEVLPKRWIVERTFGWSSKSRRLCRDYEVRLDHGESMIRICMIRLMVKHLVSI
jgi:transposase